MDLMPLINIGVSEGHRDVFMYNGRIAIIPKDPTINKEHPLVGHVIGLNKASTDGIEYKTIDESGKSHLYL